MNTYVAPPVEIDAQRDHSRPGALLLKCQAPSDVAALRKLCEPGRTVPAVMKWENGQLFAVEIVDPAKAPKASAPDPKAEAAAAEKQRMMDMAEKDLKALAGERGVRWDKDAPRETMVERIMAKASS